MDSKGSGFKLKLSDESAQLIRHSHPQLKRKLRNGLRMIAEDPNCGKALREEQKGLFSFRIGRIRIIYKTGDKNIMEIVTIGPRKTIYEETFRLLSRETGS